MSAASHVIPVLAYNESDHHAKLPILMFKELEPDWLRYNTFLSALPPRERKRRDALAVAKCLWVEPLRAHTL